jgi:hypothetical protein
MGDIEHFVALIVSYCDIGLYIIVPFWCSKCAVKMCSSGKQCMCVRAQELGIAPDTKKFAG